MNLNNNRLGIILMVTSTVIFSVQDGLSRYLGGEYNVMMVVMIRYWFFALFVIAISSRRKGGLRQVAKTTRPVLQILRGLLLVGDVCVMVLAFVLLGLAETHAIFASYPLMVAALSFAILGERVGWRRWLAILLGFTGVLIILRPGAGVFSATSTLPLLAAAMFAFYTLLTRLVAREDSAETSFFWTGVAGAVAISFIGPFFWQNLQGTDWLLMLLLCLTGAIGHYILIKAYEAAAPTVIQPFSFLQLVFVSIIGFTIFDEAFEIWIAVGAALVILSSLFTLWRERETARSRPPVSDPATGSTAAPDH